MNRRTVYTALIGWLAILGLAAAPANAMPENKALDHRHMPKSSEEYTDHFGIDLYKRGLYPEAMAVWSHAFENSQHAGAAYNLGITYLDALVTKKNPVLGIRYLRSSALRGDARAQFELGAIYDQGELAPRDLTQALLWYYMASMSNDPGAEFNLASLFESGEGVEADPVMAYAYYSLAISHDYKEFGEPALQKLSSKMTERQKEQGKLMAKQIQASRAIVLELNGQKAQQSPVIGSN